MEKKEKSPLYSILKLGGALYSALEKAIQLSMENDAELLIFHALDYRLKQKEQNDPELIKTAQQMKEKFETGNNPEILDKEIFRGWLMETYPDIFPDIKPDENILHYSSV